LAEGESGGCANCAAMEAQVSHLQQQVAHLEQENRHLRQRLERLQRHLDRARQACYSYLQQTGQVLSQSSGVPRPVWTYAKGGYTVAANLWAILNGGG